METPLVNCLEHCYECCTLVTIRGNELVIFHGIALYSDDKYIFSSLGLTSELLLSVAEDSNNGSDIEPLKSMYQALRMKCPRHA